MVNEGFKNPLMFYLLREYPTSECIDIPGVNARAFGHFEKSDGETQSLVNNGVGRED